MLEMGKMSKKRKISIILALVLTMIFVSGCAKCIDTQYSTVEVKVVDEHYEKEYLIPRHDGEKVVWMYMPAVYKITVEYNNAGWDLDVGICIETVLNRVSKLNLLIRPEHGVNFRKHCN